MCGIAGIFFTKNKPKELKEAIEKMNQAQSRRGPDDEGIFIDAKNGLSFGHRRLAILDLSKAGRQPMVWRNKDKTEFWITYNGEIYNFLELKKDLEQKGYKFKTQTDTEVILASYAEYGEKSFSMFRGMFVFGLWDGRKKRLFLVKDRYGIKPLYYYNDNEKLIFASAVKTIVKSGLISVQKNSKAFIGFLLFGSVPLPMTTIKNVLAIPAGHYLECDAANKIKLVQYYDPLDFYQHKTSENSYQSASLGIRRLLEESVNLHLISDAPLGVFLSGGLDSSVLAALAARNRGKPITTLSVIFDEKEFSEEYYSDLIAKKIGSDHRKIKIAKQDFQESFEEIFEAMDQPTVDGVNTFFIAKAAKRAGLKTVLSGLGSDEIFCGYPSFKKAEALRKIQNLPKFLKPSLDLMSLIGGRYQKLGYLKNNDILSFYLAIRGLFMPQEAAEILDINESEIKNFLEEFYSQSGYFRGRANGSEGISALASLRPVDLLSYMELKFYLQNQLLKDTDFMSMRHSVEVRVPFLDHKLVEYVSGLPAELKLNKKLNKPLLVKSAGDLLPQEIFTRPKMGFTFPFQKWLREANGNLISKKSHWSCFWAKFVLDKFNR